MDISFHSACEDGGFISILSEPSLPPFLTKTYELVDDDPSTNDIVSWDEAATTFHVWKPPEFSRYLLPSYFKHNNVLSFVHQLNTYVSSSSSFLSSAAFSLSPLGSNHLLVGTQGFKRLAPGRWAFSNQYFRRGEKHLLSQIQRRRRRSSPRASSVDRGESAVSSWMRRSMAWAMSENENLKTEKKVLHSEIEKYKKLCNEILGLYYAIQKCVSEQEEAVSSEEYVVSKEMKINGSTAC